MNLDVSSYCGGSVDREKDPIWGTPVIKMLPTEELWIKEYNSSRCGGWYSIHNRTADKIRGEWSDREKARLTSWLIEQRRSGIECPRITKDVIQLVKQRNNMSVSDRADAILKFIDSRVHKLGKDVIYASRDPIQEIEELTDEERISFFMSDASRRANYYELIAFSESIDYDELNFLLDYLKERKWIKIVDVADEYTKERVVQLYEDEKTGRIDSRRLTNTKSCLLTFEGYARLAEIQETETDSSRGFQDSSKSADYSRHVNENDKSTSEQVGVVRHQALTSPVSTRLSKSSSEPKETCSEVPKVFISYSWDNEDHKEWVKNLAEKLRNDGINAILDVWELAPGDHVTHFMEEKIRESKYVLIICTPSYREKSNCRQGGVGYEDSVMTAEIYQEENHRKFIPILAKDSCKDAKPSWLTGKLHVDLSTNESYERGYLELTATLLGERPTAPPVQRRSPNK